MYVEVILPLAVSGVFVYEVPEDLVPDVMLGKRVEVPVKNKMYSGIVYNTIECFSGDIQPRRVKSIIDAQPIILPHHFKLWRWISEYYCCTLGEVMQAALPASLKLESETQISLGDTDYQDVELSDDAFLIAEALQEREYLTIQEMQDILNKKSVYPVLRELMDLSVAKINEQLLEKYNPKIVKAVKWSDEYSGDQNRQKALDLVAKSIKQTHVLLSLINLAQHDKIITISALCHYADVDRSVVKALEKKGIIEFYDYHESRLTYYEKSNDDQSELTSDQKKVYDKIKTSFDQKLPILLMGVTGSGKTRLYIEIIKKYIAEGKQVLYLLPEIALTTQMVERVKSVFGRDMLVYHSKLSNAERVEVWKETLNGRPLILGARSALFLPFNDLGLIIVDEEHDGSYKQIDPAPRYHGRDVAVILSKLYDCKILLGSATPSTESYFNTQRGKYTLTTLSKRFNDILMPSIELIDTTKERKAKRMKSVFSLKMLKAIEEAINNKEQVIVFQNRRGYVPVLQCSDCGWTASCPNCDVKLTYHKYFNELRCHYCGYRVKRPQKCPECTCSDIREIGWGTELIEEILRENFPLSRIVRMDHDTTRTKVAYETILNDFATHKYDIMVGTQMVTKGFDFDSVSLVCIPVADALLYQPGYKATERAFQLMTQVAGRAGRRSKQGKVLIQASRTDHPVFDEVLFQKYKEFFDRELDERKNFGYPPFIKMIHIQMKHKDPIYLDEAAKIFEKRLKVKLGNGVSAPITPIVSKIKNLFLKDMYIKLIPDNTFAMKVKKFIQAEKNLLYTEDNLKGLRINLDIDPI